MAALSGAAVGATVGGVTGGLVGLGMPEYETKVYEGKLRAGKILISVHATATPSGVGLRLQVGRLAHRGLAPLSSLRSM